MFYPVSASNKQDQIISIRKLPDTLIVTLKAKHPISFLQFTKQGATGYQFANFSCPTLPKTTHAGHNKKFSLNFTRPQKQELQLALQPIPEQPSRYVTYNKEGYYYFTVQYHLPLPDEKRIKMLRQKSLEVQKKKIPVVLLDPGHGGMDSGTARGKIKEKDLTLTVAQKIHKLLLKSGRVFPILTRESDHYINLSRRRNMVEEFNADLFISIHVNAHHNRSISGFEVYTLASATDNTGPTRKLENQENLSLIIEEQSLETLDQNLSGILVDLKRSSILRESTQFAAEIRDSIKKYMPSIKRFHVKKGDFRVLRNLTAPSVLIETGYISNYLDRRKLTSSREQDKLALTMAKAILAWFPEKQPVEITTSAYPSFRIIKLQKGDTLERISIIHKVTIQKIRELNNLTTKDNLSSKQRLILPAK
jgi:N-acetylmuramoyl-L-alanine amidase